MYHCIVLELKIKKYMIVRSWEPLTATRKCPCYSVSSVIKFYSLMCMDFCLWHEAKCFTLRDRSETTFQKGEDKRKVLWHHAKIRWGTVSGSFFDLLSKGATFSAVIICEDNSCVGRIFQMLQKCPLSSCVGLFFQMLQKCPFSWWSSCFWWPHWKLLIARNWTTKEF